MNLLKEVFFKSEQKAVRKRRVSETYFGDIFIDNINVYAKLGKIYL